ncbi:MAG: hypothetical protein LUD00_12385 [Prevotellaceae bacterium]|nr:hypothetical protein [Prevotellaceae bacterium]
MKTLKQNLSGIISASIFVLTLFSCRANLPVAQQSGKEDISYLLFVSQKEFQNKTVQVTIDNSTTFEAKVVSAKKSNRRGQQYGITIGTKNIKVTYEGQTLYQKKIFLSTQEVKQIILP